MNSLDFCGTPRGAGARAGYPLRTVNSMLFDLHHQMAEQYHVYSAASPAVHTLSVAERLAGGFALDLARAQTRTSVQSFAPLLQFTKTILPS